MGSRGIQRMIKALLYAHYATPDKFQGMKQLRPTRRRLQVYVHVSQMVCHDYIDGYNVLSEQAVSSYPRLGYGL